MFRVLLNQKRAVKCLRLIQLRPRSFGSFHLSKVTKDVRENFQVQQENSDLEGLGRGQFANQIPDYEVSYEDIIIKTKPIELNDSHKEHPLETQVRIARQKSDFFQKLQENQIILTNLPFNEGNKLSSPAQVSSFLKEKVHKDLDVQKVEFIRAIQPPGAQDRIAYIIVTLGSKRQAYRTKSELRKEWIGNSLLKIKTQEDVKREHFNNRTIVVREIPRYLRIEHVLGIFGSKYGSVVNVELPTEFKPIKDLINEQNQRVGQKADDEKVASIRAAELQIKQSLEVDQEYHGFLQQHLGDEISASVLHSMKQNPNLKAPEALDQERLSSLLTMVTHLQAEGQNVLKKKLELLELKSQHFAIDASQTESDELSAKAFVEQNQDKIMGILKYLEKSRSQEVVVKNSQDFLQNLLNLTKGELMYAYDELINELDFREKIVSERLRQSVESFNENERILLEGKDWSKENEDVGDPFNNPLAKIEQFINVNQQIYDIYSVKKMSTEEKLYRILQKELNPFIEGNFNELAIGDANQDLAKEWKYSNLPNLNLNKTLMRQMALKTDFQPGYKEKFEEMLSNIRSNFELPFDEIYHKEKKVIADVIEAQKILETKQAQMRSPLEHRLLDEKLLTAEQRAKIQHLIDDSKPRFEQSIEREQERVLLTQIEKLDSKMGMVGKYAYTQNDEQKWRAMVEDGELSESDLTKLLQIRKENDTQNLGYCFITFSHADEARMMLLQNKNPYFLEDKQIVFDLKQNIDHGDLDMHYTIKRSKNDSMLIEEIEKLREAKKNLREFEKSMDKMLPKNQKLQKFQERAKDLLENHEFDTRREKTAGGRSEMDQARLDRKIRDLEKKFPNVNFTQLYATEQAEAAKLALHKKSYASYKAFQFLKNGIKTNKDAKEEALPKVSKAKQRMIDNDPYNFPLMDETVHKILSKDVVAPTVIDKGDRISKPGRRQNINVQEYIESQFGKDLLRQPRDKIHNDGMFVFQETLKKKYPMEQFLKLPEVERKLKKLEDLGLDYDYKKFPQLKFKDDNLAALIEEQGNNFYEQQFGGKVFNLQHPTDPTRNIVEDQIKLYNEAVEARKEKTGGEEQFYAQDIDKIRKELVDEYQFSDNLQRHMPLEEKIFHQFNAASLRGKEEFDDDLIISKIGEKKGAKFETDYSQGLQFESQELDEEKKHINREFFYRAKVNPESVDQSLNDKLNEILKKEHQQKPFNEKIQSSQEKVDVYNDMLKDQALIYQAGKKYGGKFFQNHRIGMDRVEERFQSNKSSKGLKEFFEKTDEEQDSQSQGEDDMDIYEHYKRQVENVPKSKHDEERILKYKIDSQKMQPEMPRFDSYFDSKAKGVHPFDQIANSFDESEIRTVEDDDFEKLEEEALYKRELMGRMMGQKLTPRQFEILSGQFSSSDAKLERVQEIGKLQFLDNRDNIRLVEEMLEKYRRNQVNNGTWSENESNQKLQETISNFVQNSIPASQMAKINRELVKLYQGVRMIDNPESLFEKEYHFDEGLGVSLSDHMEKLRKDYPGTSVMSRRDREGFAIIKVSFKPEYKFNIDTLINLNIEEEKAKFLQSTEDIIKKLTNGQNIESFVSKQQISDEIKALAQDQKLVPDLSSFGKLAINQLIKERIDGIYKNDNERFVEEIFKIIQSEQYSSKDTKVKAPSMIDFDWDKNSQKSIVDEIFEDRDRFRMDMHDQLRRRFLKYQTMTKRKESDFIKPKVNEKDAFENQKTLNDLHLSHLEEKSRAFESQDTKSEDFDKEAYYKLKEELSLRKEAKERLLSQGFPQFKAYLRF